MGLLEAKYSQLVKEYGKTDVLRRIRDRIGVYALEIRRPDNRVYLFAAKRNMDGTIVSVHNELWLEARAYQKPIILAVAEYFYLFYPRNVELVNHWTNMRGSTLMMNWDLVSACGQNLKYIGQKKIDHPVGKILQEKLQLV